MEHRQYEIVDNEELALLTDAVVVGIAADPLTGAFLSAGVAWPDAILSGDRVKGGGEGPFSMPEALRRADEIMLLYGFKRVVISMDPAVEWQPEWGALIAGRGV